MPARTRSRTPTKKATSAMITDFFPTVKPTKTAPTVTSMAEQGSTLDAAGVAFSRSSSTASTPATQTPAVSAPPTPTPHSNRRAANSASQQNDAHLAALHETILRVDDFADLTVGPLAIRRASPTTSVFAPATVLKDNVSRLGAKVAGLFNQFVDVGAGVPSNPIKTPHFPGGNTNDTGCLHCTHTTQCDCEYVADVFFDVFENQLTQKRITERSSSSAAAAAHAHSRSRSLTESSAAGSSTSSANISVLSTDDENSYGSAPAALSQLAVTSKTMVGSSTRHLCAKSLLPPFVSRIIRLLDLQPGDTFYDLGCGNGSILFQVALSAGATCVGVELCPHNAQLAREAWSHIRPIFESKLNSLNTTGAKRRGQNVGLPHVEIITGDIANIITDPAFTSRPRKILLSNLLFPKELTLFISEACRKLPKGSMVVCFDDLYPHGRSVSRIRDPEAFELFQMTDYEWPKGSVEWTYQEGKFYVHTRK